MSNDLQASGKATLVDLRIFSHLLKYLSRDHLYCLGSVAQRLAHQLQIVRIQLDCFEWRERLIVQDIEVALDTAGVRITLSPNKTQPARQAQQGQGAGYGFIGRLRGAGHDRQVWAEPLIGRKGCQAAAIQQHVQNLPGVALQRRQAPIKQERAR
ncbi:hypothetical protein PPL19_08071 [Pseudomonas psychrotolerans L19]|nr:hypothetical protein PPL19_08071 [Pseudomonas psychrotolerans L19]